MTAKNTSPIFDYRALRLLMGIIAFSLAPIVTIISSMSLSSVSASYHTEARDVFIGMLFVVSALLWAYNGHTVKEALASKGASVAAILVALCPTSCPTCKSDPTSIVHTVAAIILFATLAYFCFGPFRQNTKGRHGKKGRRSRIYFACGCVMVVCMLSGLIAKFTLTRETMDAWSVLYWVEAIALGTFGFAWIVAGKYFRIFVDEDEALHLFWL